mmetsp:Transcript_23327/g.51268  ORF Transcript_23327/g.51268 Transcript_23327/m.51268 type:complete len:330 (+) Transcript_23327:195-1184(+)
MQEPMVQDFGADKLGQTGELDYDPGTGSTAYDTNPDLGMHSGPYPMQGASVGGVSGRPMSAVSARSAGANGLTVHEANRAKKMIESNAKAIENRIRFFKREEEKIWRDLEEVRRQAATIEEGRTRTLEKKLADKAIQQERELILKQNRARVAANRNQGQDVKRHNQAIAEREKKLAGDEQRRMSQDILRQKRMQEAQQRLSNSERAVAIQRSQLEARLKVTQERANRIERLKLEHEAERQAAEAMVAEAETRLPQLEAEEMLCLQRLQNSRIVTQSVLEELESSLGKQSAVTSLLRSKQRGQDIFGASMGSVGAGNSIGMPLPEEGELK